MQESTVMAILKRVKAQRSCGKVKKENKKSQYLAGRLSGNEVTAGELRCNKVATSKVIESAVHDKAMASFGHVCGKVSKTSIEEELFFQVYQTLCQHGLKSYALSITEDLTKRLSQIWGGCQMYFPKPDVFEVQEKYEKIYRDFTGKNHRMLAATYHYSLPTIYRIIAMMSKTQRCHCLQKMLEDDQVR